MGVFSLNLNKLNYKHELIGGINNFLAICYIIAVNPLILHANGVGFPLNAAITATVMVVFIMSIIASFFVKLPLAIIPGMGVNAIIAYNFVLHDHLSIPTVLAVVFLSSILLLIFSLTKIRHYIIKAIPENLQLSLSAGIGFFLFFIGVRNIGLVTSNPHTLLSIGPMNLNLSLSLIGFFLALTLFIYKKVYAFILPIVLVTIIYLMFNHNYPSKIITAPDFSLFLQLDLLSAFKLSIIPAVLSLFVVSFFDATSTVVGLLSQMHFNSQHEKGWYLKRALLTDSLGGIFASILGASSTVVAVESSVAINNGAKTGFAALITGLLALPFLFLSPLISLIPSFATSPILMVVGLIMLSQITKIKFNGFEELVVVILTIIMMPLTFSITTGALFGILSHVVLKLLLGKFKDLNTGLVILSLAALFWFTFGL